MNNKQISSTHPLSPTAKLNHYPPTRKYDNKPVGLKVWTGVRAGSDNCDASLPSSSTIPSWSTVEEKCNCK